MVCHTSLPLGLPLRSDHNQVPKLTGQLVIVTTSWDDGHLVGLRIGELL